MSFTPCFFRKSAIVFLLFSTLLVSVASGQPNLDQYSVDAGDGRTIVTYQYTNNGVDEIRLCEYDADPVQLDQDNVECGSTLASDATDCLNVPTSSCSFLDTKHFNMMPGRLGGSCIKNPGDESCIGATGTQLSYYNCDGCLCLAEYCDAGDEFCQCDELRVVDYDYTFPANEPRHVFCGNSQHPRESTEWSWAGDHVEYACFVVDVGYYVADNDEGGAVDVIRDESWDYYDNSPATVCNGTSLEHEGPGSYGDCCWGGTWWAPSAGFCATPYIISGPGEEDGYCFDGYCAFAIDDQTSTEDPNNEAVWDAYTIGYAGSLQYDTTKLPPEETVGHFCTGYQVTGLHVATFCADQDAGGSWESTRALPTCANAADDDGDSWTDEYFRWTNEQECVECNNTHHVKDNTPAPTYTSSDKDILCEVGCLASPGCDEVLPASFNGSGVWCDEYCKVSLLCPHNGVPQPGEACYNPGVYNWGFCTTSSPSGPNICHAETGDTECNNIEETSKCYCVARANLTLDIGNDNEIPWEWENSSLDFHKTKVWKLWRPEMEEYVVDKLNDVLESECDGANCTGCVIQDEDCLIPFAFQSNQPNASIPASEIINGILLVNDINFTFWQYHTLENVEYGRIFQLSGQGNWTFDYEEYSGPPATSPEMGVPQDAGGYDPHTYLYGSNPATATDDAIDDAMYRLLVKLDEGDDSVVNLIETMDEEYDVPFDANGMWFDGESVVKSMSLLGPIEVKLVVWI